MNQEFSIPSVETLKHELTPNLQNLDPQVQQQVIQILNTIIRPDCNRSQLSLISRLGLLEETPLLKSHIWKMLLGTIQMAPHKWNYNRSHNKELYMALKEKFCNFEVDQTQQINQHEQKLDKELWAEIALDTKRTHSTINFFQSQVNFTRVYKNKITKNTDVLSRILYIWSKTNSAVKYVQGMNEILAPLYYLEFQSMENGDWDRESEVFAMFTAIMGYVIDMHIKEMDDCQNGIMGRMIYLNRYLRVVDQQLWKRLQSQGIYPQCYSFRWLALLLSQQFGLYDTIRLWDHIISYTEETRFFFLFSLCIAVLKIRREVIMTTDFMTFLPLLQKLRDIDIQNVIELGTEFFHKYKKININKEFEKLQENENKAINSVKIAQQIHMKSGSWSYIDILKETTVYLGKITSFRK